jgi:hypothetical protein
LVLGTGLLDDFCAVAWAIFALLGADCVDSVGFRFKEGFAADSVFNLACSFFQFEDNSAIILNNYYQDIP